MLSRRMTVFRSSSVVESEAVLT